MKTHHIFAQKSDLQWNWDNGEFVKLPKGDGTTVPVDNWYDEWKAAKLAFQKQFHPLSDTILTLAYAEYDKEESMCDFLILETVNSWELVNRDVNGLTV